MPGPAPNFQPTFPSEFVSEAEEVVCQRTAAYRRWQRAMLVLLLHEDPKMSNVDAGAAIGLSDQAVRMWRRRWDSGDFSLEDKPGRGRKPGFSPLGTVVGESNCLRVGQ
jgi:hypothetical protein